MVERIECSVPDDFSSKIKEVEIKANGRPFFVLFYGAKTNAPGISWCPDCVAAEPIIDEALSSIEGGCVLLSCSVEREEYRTPSYAYRTNPAVNLTCVPTLMKWSNGKCIARLNDNQSQRAELVAELLDA